MVLASSLVIAVILTVSGCAVKYPRVYPPQQPSVIYDQARYLIETNYIDTSGKGITLDVGKRPDISSLLTQLGPSAEWISWKKAVKINNPYRAGIGIAFRVKDDEVRISKIVGDSPAHRAGLKEGDRIIKIDNEPVNGLSPMLIIANLQGSPGTDVVVTIAGPKDETKEFKMTRSILDWGPAVAEQFIEENIGYLRIGTFNEHTPQEVESAMKSLMREKIRGLVIDVRDNQSYADKNVAGTAQLFLDRGASIAHLSGRTPELNLTYTSGGWTHYLNVPMVILINETTVLGAEMFAAALHDHKRALLIGEKTGGNGEIKSHFQLKDGSFLIIRTHYLKTPSGEPIEDRGVLPEVAIELSALEKDAVFRRIHSHLPGKADDISSDHQLTAAVSELNRQIISHNPGVK